MQPVQTVSGTSTGTSLSLTLASTTKGNTLVVTVVTSATPANPTVSSITLGGTSVGSQVATAGSVSADAQSSFMWQAQNIAGGQTAFVCNITTGNTGSFCVIVEEWPPMGVVDVTSVSANGTSGTTFSSGASGTTKQSEEVAIGCVGAFNATAIGTITGPTSPWVNQTQETSASTHVGLLMGYENLSTTGTATYSGSFGVTASYAAIVAVFRAGPLIDIPVTTNQVAAATGVATSTTTLSPAAGWMVLVIASWMFGTNATGVSWTCQDSNAVSYASAVQKQDINGVGGCMIFWHVYSSAPGNITLKITCTNTGAADCQISPRMISGQAASPIGPNTISTNNSSNSTAVTSSLTTTQVGSLCYLAADWAASTTAAAAANTTIISTWSDATQGDTGVSGVSTATTVTPGSTSFGFTAGSATEYGLVGVEILPLVASSAPSEVISQAVKRAAYY